MLRKLVIIACILTLASPAAFAADSKDEVAKLLKQLREDKDPSARSRAARALENIDPSAKDAVPVLIEALKEKQDVTVPPVAAKALGRLGRKIAYRFARRSVRMLERLVERDNLVPFLSTEDRGEIDDIIRGFDEL